MGYCSNCGTQISDDAEECPSCGASFKDQPVDHLTEPESGDAEVSLAKTVGSYFTSPFDGFRHNMINCRQPALGAFILLAASLLIFYLFISLALSSASRYGNGLGFGELLQFGLFLGLIILAIGLFMLFVKLVAQAPLDFGRDLLSASFAVSSIVLMYVFIILIGMMASDKTYGFDPLGSFQSSFYKGSAFRVILTLSAILLCLFKALNSIIQGLRNEPVKDTTAYYLAPFILITGIYLGALAGAEIIGVR